MMRPVVDLVLGDRYRLSGRIAGGGMGEVWLAEDTVLGRPVAVKILRREYVDDPTFLARFRAEARHAAGLSHPNIAAVYDFSEGADLGEGKDLGEGDDDPGAAPYLVMEHVPGEPLSAMMAREGPLTPERALDIIGQAALGLQAAHDAGVIHRDVKPGNLLVTPEGQVKITDFGIARATNSVPLTLTGTIMGTAYYISPEQASGQSVIPASDVYSLGIVAYECLTGRRPFDGDTPVSVALAQVSQLPPALPAELPAPMRALVMRMLAKDPAARPGSAGALGAEALALRPVVADAPAVAAPAADPSAGTAPGAPGATGAPGSAPDRVGTGTDPGFRLPAPTRRPHWWPYLLVLGAAALALLVLAVACGASSDGAVVGTVEVGRPAGPAPGGSAVAPDVVSARATTKERDG